MSAAIERAREVLAEFDDGQPYDDGHLSAAAWSDAWQSYRLGQVTEILRQLIREADADWRAPGWDEQAADALRAQEESPVMARDKTPTDAWRRANDARKRKLGKGGYVGKHRKPDPLAKPKDGTK
jgi:hypothetical protein